MPIFEVTDPTTGQVLELEGDSPPSQAELEAIFSRPQPKTAGVQGGVVDPEEAADPRSFLDELVGGLEVAGTLVTGALAEPVAGLAGIAQAVNPFADEGAGERAVEGVREALTFQPRTEAGKEDLAGAGEFLAPVGEALQSSEKFLGDAAFELTGSPAVAAGAATLPTLVIELLGARGVKQVAKLKKAKELKKMAKVVDESLEKAIPSAKKIKQTSREIFDEIDQAGVTIKPKAMDEMTRILSKTMKKEKLNPLIHKNTAAAFDDFKRSVPKKPARGKQPAGFTSGAAKPAQPRRAVNLQELEDLRKLAQDAKATALKQGADADARLAGIIVDKIDAFMDGAGEGVLNIPAGASKQTAQKYKIARGLWGRAKRDEMLTEAITRGETMGSGFENGIRRQFDQILKNRSKARFFNKAEREAMKKVVKGGKIDNAFKVMGKFGLDLENNPKALLPLLGAGVGSTFGPAGFLLMPTVGWFGGKQALKRTLKNADNAKRVVRAGRDARRLTEAYIKSVPEGLRTAEELAEILMGTGARKLETLTTDMGKRAADLVRLKRRAMATGVTAGAVAQEVKSNEALQP